MDDIEAIADVSISSVYSIIPLIQLNSNVFNIKKIFASSFNHKLKRDDTVQMLKNQIGLYSSAFLFVIKLICSLVVTTMFQSM